MEENADRLSSLELLSLALKKLDAENETLPAIYVQQAIDVLSRSAVPTP